MSTNEKPKPEGEYYSDRSYEIADAMFEGISPQDSEEDIFNAMQVLLDYLREDYPNVLDRLIKYYTSMVMGSIMFGGRRDK
jgi:hypothetical protein